MGDRLGIPSAVGLFAQRHVQDILLFGYTVLQYQRGYEILADVSTVLLRSSSGAKIVIDRGRVFLMPANVPD